MKQQRLDSLADGIFAIVMTLLVFQMSIPVFGGGHPTDADVARSLVQQLPVVVSFLLSFALLFTYWRAHHFLTSVYAKVLTVGLANYNAVFFFFITLVPFSSQLLGAYPYTHVAIIIYGANVIAIGFTLFLMRYHIEKSPKIETSPITKQDLRSGYIRILFPVVCAAIAIAVAYWNISISIAFFTLGILFNILPASSNIIHGLLDRIFADEDDILVS